MSHEKRTSRLTWITLAAAALLIWAGFALKSIEGSDLLHPASRVVIGVGMGLCLLWLVPPRWHKRLLLAVATLAVSLVAVEVGLRLFSPWGASTVYELHPRYLHRYIPGSSKVYTRMPENGGQTVFVHVNGRGFRGPPLAEPRTADLRVLVCGDSSVAAEFSALEDTFVSRLEVHLAEASDRTVETINAGVVGYGPDQSLLRLEGELQELDPDLVVVVLFADNDFGDLVRNKAFRIDRHGGIARNEVQFAAGLGDDFQSAASPIALDRMASRVPTTRARAAPVISEADVARAEESVEFWLRQCRIEYTNTVVDGDPEVWNLLGDHYDADVSLLPNSESSQYKIGLMSLVVAELQRLCDRAGVTLVFLFLPSPVDVCDDWDLGRVNRSRYPEYAPANLTNALCAIAKKSDSHYLDLFPEYLERGPRRLYFRHGNNHWSDEGQDVAARLLSRYLSDEVLSR